MPRISKKLIASVIGSLALVSAAACEQRTEPQPDPATTTPAQEPNALRPTPSTSTPGTPGTAAPGTMTPSIDNSDTLPVRGTDPDMQAGGAGGAGGHAGHGGSAGHGGAKSPH